MSLNKIPKLVTAKDKEGSCRPLEVQALVREIFGPVGNLLKEAALQYVFLTVRGVSLFLSFNES